MNLRKLTGVLAMMLLTAAFSVTAVFAAEFREDSTGVAADEVISDDLYLSGEVVRIEGKVDGDALVAGSYVYITGEVTGDLYVAGNEVYVDGVVGGNLIAAGSELSVDGEVGENAILAAGRVSVKPTATVGEDLVSAAGETTIDGDIADDVRIASGTLVMGATVGDSAVISSDNVTVDEENIAGEYSLFTSATDGGHKGETTNKTPVAIMTSLLMGAVYMAGRYLVGLFLMKAAPSTTDKIVEYISTDWQTAAISLLMGIFVSIGLPFVAVILLFTIIGTPFAILMLVGLLFIALFGKLWAELAVGRVVLNKISAEKSSDPLALFVGMVITLVRYIPVIGGIYNLALIWISFGAIARMKWDAFKK